MQVCPDLGQFVSLRRLLPEAEILGAGRHRISGCAAIRGRSARASCSPPWSAASTTATISSPRRPRGAVRPCLATGRPPT